MAKRDGSVLSIVRKELEFFYLESMQTRGNNSALTDTFSFPPTPSGGLDPCIGKSPFGMNNVCMHECIEPKNMTGDNVLF